MTSGYDSTYVSPFSSAASVVINTVAPTITSITVSSITKASASITWITDQQASSQIAYGRTDSYGSATTETDTSPRVTSHRVVLTGLAACTSYHYRATSVDALGNAGHSSDKTFKTAGCATPLRPTPAQNTSQSEPTIQQSQNSDATKSKPKDNSDSSQPTSSDTSPPTAKSENTNNDQGPSKNTSTFLGLGWWWLLVLTLAASLWWLIILGRRRKREGTGR